MRIRVIASLCLLWGLPALAQDAVQCVVPDPPASQSDKQTQVDAVLKDLGNCQQSARWLAWAGEQLVKAQRYSLAVDYLERALLLEPQLMAAQIDYALALAGNGQADSAIHLMNNLLLESELPRHLHQVLQQQIARWTSTLEPQHTHRWYAALRYGYDSNLLGSPNLGSLSLTFPGQNIDLPLDSSYLDRSGNYIKNELGWSHQQTWPHTGQVHTYFNLGSRQSPTASHSNLQQANLGIEYTHLNGLFVDANWAALDSQSGTQYRTHGFRAGRQWDAPWYQQPQGPRQCRVRASMEWQDRQLASNSRLSGIYNGLQASWLCETAQAGFWLVQATLGQDRNTDPERPGGAQREWGLRALGKTPGIWLPGSLLAELEIDRRSDRAPYSALLGNLPRTTARTTARIEWQGAEQQKWQPQAGLQWVRQSANLPLFQFKGWGPYLTVRTFW